jgi:hypothetical protein
LKTKAQPQVDGQALQPGSEADVAIAPSIMQNLESDTVDLADRLRRGTPLTGFVNRDTAVVYAGPGANSQMIGKLSRGVKVKVVQREGIWGQLSSEGWIKIADIVY